MVQIPPYNVTPKIHVSFSGKRSSESELFAKNLKDHPLNLKSFTSNLIQDERKQYKNSAKLILDPRMQEI